jgi:hypothetical protein
VWPRSALGYVGNLPCWKKSRGQYFDEPYLDELYFDGLYLDELQLEEQVLFPPRRVRRVRRVPRDGEGPGDEVRGGVPV